MTAESSLTADLSGLYEQPGHASRLAATVSRSWADLERDADEIGRYFYATLFSRAPETRELFPVNMEVQRSRLLRAIVHVVQMVDRTDELVRFLEQLGRDHRKFGVLAQHYDAVGAALMTALQAFAGDRWTPEVAQAWTETYRMVGNAMQTAAAAERGPATWRGRVVEHRRIGWDIATITVQTDEPLPYRAGQYVSVEIPQRPRLWRYLSPANAPRDDGVLEFHVRAVAGGWVSRAVVAHTRVGDIWRIGPPMGRLHLNIGFDRDLLMIAGSTGIAPIRSLLEELTRHDRQPRTRVFVGARTRDDLYDLPSLHRLSYHHHWLDVVPVVEDDDDTPGVETGTLAEVVSRYGSWTDHDVLVCGSPSMIRATVTQMLVAGTPLDRIAYDPFTHD